MDEGQESTEKVEKTGELQEGLLGLHQKMDQLLEALCGRPVARHTSSFAGKPRRRAADLVERPWDSTPLQGARFKKPIGGAVVRWRLEGFGFVKVDGADVFTHASVVRGPLEGLVGCRVVIFLEVDVVKSTANDMKYRAPPRADEEILAKTRAEEAAEAALRAAGEARQRAEATQDAMEKAALAQLRAQWNRPPGLLTTKMVDMGVQTSLVSDLSIEASSKMTRLWSGFPFPLWTLRRTVKGASQGDLRGERGKGEGGAGEEVGPEGDDEKGGEGAQRRACE